MLLSVTIISVLVGIMAPATIRVQTKNDLDTAVAIWASSLRRASVLASASTGDSQWGVAAQSGSIRVFKGASFAARDAGFDEIFDVPTTISFSGTTEFVMDKLTGYPTATGTTTISSSVTNDSSNVTINSKGTVSY